VQVKRNEELQKKAQEEELKKKKEKEMKRKRELELELQKKRILEYKAKKKQTEMMLANANYVDFEDIANEEEYLQDDDYDARGLETIQEVPSVQQTQQIYQIQNERMNMDLHTPNSINGQNAAPGGVQRRRPPAIE
jgi:hypothetical protein